MRALSVVVCAMLLVSGGCFGVRKLTWEEKMDSSAGVERTQGVVAVGEENKWSAIPQVIDRLEDDDVSVRVTAVRTLREMTGCDFGYVAYADEPERREAAQRWRNGWNTVGRNGPGASAAPTGEKP